MAGDAPNATTPTSTVLMRWVGFSVILAFAVLYVMMRTIGFVHEDALFIAGISTVPLAVAAIVGLAVWKLYWHMD